MKLLPLLATLDIRPGKRPTENIYPGVLARKHETANIPQFRERKKRIVNTHT